MPLPNGGLSDWDRLTIVSKAASATKCANYRNAITKGDATLPPRKNNKAKLLSDESSSSNNGANNNVTTMWQLLPIFSNKGSEKEAKNKTEKEKTKAEAAQKKNYVLMAKNTYSRFEIRQLRNLTTICSAMCVCAGKEGVWGMTAISHAHTAQPAAKQLENTQLLKSSSSK